MKVGHIPTWAFATTHVRWDKLMIQMGEPFLEESPKIWQCAGIGVPNLIGNFRRMFGKRKDLKALDVLIIDEVRPCTNLNSSRQVLVNVGSHHFTEQQLHSEWACIAYSLCNIAVWPMICNYHCCQLTATRQFILTHLNLTS